jgi:hypothetical protein
LPFNPDNDGHNMIPMEAIMAKINGIENMSIAELQMELNRGGKFVLYQWALSILILSFRRSSPVYFIRAGEDAVVKGVPYTVLSLLLGWWGFPWGPIFTIQALSTNLSGGKDVTSEILSAFGLMRYGRG